MHLSVLQTTYALHNLLHRCKSPEDELLHLQEEVDELRIAVKYNSEIAREIADVIIVATILANWLGIDIDKAVTEKTEYNLRKKRLRR